MMSTFTCNPATSPRDESWTPPELVKRHSPDLGGQRTSFILTLKVFPQGYMMWSGSFYLSDT